MSTVLAPPTPLDAAVATLRAADPAAFAVAPRVLRRVIRHEFEFHGFGRRVPHRLSFVIARERLRDLVASDELGVDDLGRLPETVILLARPEESDLERMTQSEIAARFRRLLYHAQVHVALDELRRSGRLTPAGIRRRIDLIGQAEFDEAHAVLRQEHFLAPDAGLADVYVEFAAVWFEMRRCAARLVPVWFPSLRDPERVDRTLGDDLDVDRLWDGSRILGECVEEDDGELASTDAAPLDLTPEASWWQRTFARRIFLRRMRKARAAEHRGNDVRAAIIWRRATIYAGAGEGQRIDESVARVVERLTRRLQAALEFDDSQAGVWRRVLVELARNSTRGFWTADARLLYDLQKVCLDHERAVSAVDLLGWAFTLGRRPFKRLLPNQREVLMSKHLHSAARRTAAVRLSGELREKLSALIEDAAHSAEHQMRRRLRPLIGKALTDVGLVPADVPERVAFRKIVERLLDSVVRQGYVTMGDLRDSISRNNLKLSDLSGAAEFLRGDELLRADRRLASKLDGVYRRGDIYIRALQGLSAAAFGTKTGRFLVKYLAIPFGGAFVIIRGLLHLVNAIGHVVIDSPELPDPRDPSKLLPPPDLIPEDRTLDLIGSSVLGVLLLLLIHVPLFRRAAASAAKSLYHVLKGIFVDLPRALFRLEAVRAFLRHPAVSKIRRWLVQPAMITGLIWLAAPLFGSTQRPGGIGTATIFLASWLIFNSRTGRDIEELAAEQIERLWHRIRIHVFVALFDLVMESFKRVLDVIEKLLYEVDEFLRFRSGESSVALVIKGVLGIVWGMVTFVVRFCVTLLIEPQVNPIKHFPVVTVSHKIILPFAFVVAKPFENFTDPITAKFIGTTIVTCIPGIFGFLVWELRENWRLYAANRLPRLGPVIVGDHGETMTRLLEPGFHSGTIPKHFAQRRRAARSGDPSRRRSGELKFQLRARHLAESVRRFVARELVALIEESGTLDDRTVSVGTVRIGINSLHVELRLEGAAESAWVSLLEQSGWIMADVEPGWISELPPHERERLSLALNGFLRMAATGLVRAQIEASLPSPTMPFDVADRGLVVWPDGSYESEIVYDLKERPKMRPRPRELAGKLSMPAPDATDLVFDTVPCPWNEWVDVWSVGGENGRPRTIGWRAPVLSDVAGGGAD